MERYRWNSNCDGESGRCLADIIPDADGDYVLFADAAAELDRLHAEMADLRAAFLTLREMYESREARIGAAHAEHIARMESTLVAVSKKMTEREAALENSKSRLAGAAGEIHKLRCMTPEEAAWQAAIAEERKEGPDCGRCQKIHLHNWRFGGPWCVFQKGGISECVNGSQFVARPTVRLYAGGDDARPG